MNPDPRPTSTQAAFSGQQQPAAPRDPRRGRIVLPFDPQPVDLGTWTYEHKVGLCVMIIAYLVLGIIFVTTKLVVGGAPPDQHTIYLDMVPPPPEQKQELTPEERRQMEADLSNAHNAISNEDARNEASRQNERTSGAGSGGSQGSSNGSPIPDNIADEADAVAARMRASREAYERGLREEQAMIDAHNAGKRSKDNQGKKQEDVRVTGNVLISFSLAGRTFTYMHVPAYQCEGSGQVVVSISVNRNGKVTSASVRSSTSGEDVPFVWLMASICPASMSTRQLPRASPARSPTCSSGSNFHCNRSLFPATGFPPGGVTGPYPTKKERAKTHRSPRTDRKKHTGSNRISISA